MVSGITRRQHSVLPVDSLVKYTDSEGTEPGLSYMISFTHFRSVAPSRIWSGDEPLATLSRKKSFMNLTISAPVEYMPPEVTQHKERQQRSNKPYYGGCVHSSAGGQSTCGVAPAKVIQIRRFAIGVAMSKARHIGALRVCMCAYEILSTLHTHTRLVCVVPYRECRRRHA